MEPTGRFFLCERCRAQVLICSGCDRGQIYCTEACSAAARAPRYARQAGATRRAGAAASTMPSEPAATGSDEIK